MKNGIKSFWLLCFLFVGCVVQAGEPSGHATVPQSAAVRQTIEPTTFAGLDAWRLTDGRTEAVVVPAWGRVMSYGPIGGPNWLWVNSQKEFKPGEWRNHGGDKTWLAPQAQWRVVHGGAWPPPREWDGMAHKAGVKDGKLWMVSPVQPVLGIRTVRQFWFEANGDFVIEQAAEKTKGDPCYLALWSVIQVAPPEAIFLPINPNSPYKGNFFWMGKPKVEVDLRAVTPTLLRVVPSALEGGNFKIGLDAPHAATVAVRGGWAFVAKTDKPTGDLPEGATGAGFPVELYNHGAPQGNYNELELLAPLSVYKPGTRVRQTIHWSLHQLPTKDINAPEMHAAIERLVGG